MSNSTDNYRAKLSEFSKTEKELENLLTGISEKYDYMNVQKAEKKLAKHKEDLANFKTLYLRKRENHISLLTDKEYRRRLDEISAYINRCENYEKEFTKFTTQRYKSTLNPESFKESEEVRNMNRREYLQYQKRTLNQQDELIDSMIGLNKENKEIGKAMDDQLKTQIKQLENIHGEMDKVGSKMNRANSRLQDFIENTSNCKLYVIIALQAFIIVYLLTSL